MISNGSKKGNFARAVRAVGWAFLGVNKRKNLEEDARLLNPIHVIVIGLIGMAIFIAVLILVVHMVVG